MKVKVTCLPVNLILSSHCLGHRDDPLNDDTNDIDEHGMALLVYEDIYLCLYRTDGPAAAFALRERVLQRYKQGRGLDCYRHDLQGYALWEPYNHPLYVSPVSTPKKTARFSSEKNSERSTSQTSCIDKKENGETTIQSPKSEDTSRLSTP